MWGLGSMAIARQPLYFCIPLLELSLARSVYVMAAGARHVIVRTLTASFIAGHEIIVYTKIASVRHHGNGMSPGRATRVRMGHAVLHPALRIRGACVSQDRC
jgi:hypothetical protein